jgi:hypothetical protein
LKPPDGSNLADTLELLRLENTLEGEVSEAMAILVLSPPDHREVSFTRASIGEDRGQSPAKLLKFRKSAIAYYTCIVIITPLQAQHI